MIVRALDTQKDWSFGKSLSDYISNNAAVAQLIETRLSSFLGDCFFDLSAGINWFSFLAGSKNELALILAIQTVISNTPQVTGILQLSVDLNHVNRTFTVVYRVQTTYSVTGNTFQYNLGAST